MKRAAVLLADGFEEGEALFTVDILRRTGVECDMVSIAGDMVTGSHGIPVMADRLFDKTEFGGYDMVILPGGMPGAKNLSEDERVLAVVRDFMNAKKFVAAICAAPIVLHAAGVSNGRRITCYPKPEYKNLFEKYADDELVVVDGNLITSRGPATVMPFAYTLAELLGAETASVKEGMLWEMLKEKI